MRKCLNWAWAAAEGDIEIEIGAMMMARACVCPCRCKGQRPFHKRLLASSQPFCANNFSSQQVAPKIYYVIKQRYNFVVIAAAEWLHSSFFFFISFPAVQANHGRKLRLLLGHWSHTEKFSSTSNSLAKLLKS